MINNPYKFGRSLTVDERLASERGRKSADAFTARRSQILLASPGRVVGCTAPAVRNAVRGRRTGVPDRHVAHPQGPRPSVGPGQDTWRTCSTASRDDPPGVEASGRGVEAGQARDHQPRPHSTPRKKLHDRLIAEAAKHSDGELGFRDERWWPRLAQPDLSSWAGAPLRLGPERGWRATGCCERTPAG